MTLAAEHPPTPSSQPLTQRAWGVHFLRDPQRARRGVEFPVPPPLGTTVFSNPWCALLDLTADRARTMGQKAHRAGLLNLRAVGEVVDLSFPLLAEFQTEPS